MGLTRRTWLWSALGGSGALVVGWSGLPPRSRLGGPDTLPSEAGSVGLNGWIAVRTDGQVELAMPWAEIGQGVHTALAMLVAEEMNLRLDQVHPIEAPHEKIYGNLAVLEASLPVHPRHAEPGHETLGVRLGQWMVRKLARELGLVITGGSSTMADSWDTLRLAAATARAQLLGAASLQWKQPVAELQLAAGVVRHAAEHQAHYGELATAAQTTRPGEVRFKPRDQWTLIGRPQPRLDALPKSRGQARFGIDVRQPGQRFAVLRHAPALGGRIGALRNEAAVRAMPGVLGIHRLPAPADGTESVAVVAHNTGLALQALRALDLEALPPEGGGADSARILQALQEQARRAAAEDEGFSFHADGDAVGTLARSAEVVEALYHAPYLAHATMEPMNATVRVDAQGVEVWAPTQVPGLARAAAARQAGVPEERVRLHMTLSGGGFGRRLEVDSVVQAVALAQQMPGQAVQLLWPREEDFGHDLYRPAGAALLRAALDGQGRIRALSIHSTGDAITPRWMARNAPWLSGPIDTPDKTTAEGLYDLPYAIAQQRMRHVATRSGVPIGNWRSVGHSHNAFFSESFIDELAHAARRDPLDFRLALLGEAPRHAAVLRLAADRAGWGKPLPAGRARGLALHESFGSIVALVLEVSAAEGRPRVHRAVCAVDCGTVINPDGIAQQVEGSIVFGLSAALFGRIDIVAGVVQQTNFPAQMPLTLRQTPAIETHLVPSSRAPTGMGEPAVPPVAPALANALFVLSGKRQRSLPLA